MQYAARQKGSAVSWAYVSPEAVLPLLYSAIDS